MFKKMPQQENLDRSSKIIIRSSTNDDIHSIVNAFSEYLEELEDIEEQDLTFTDNNVKLFRLMLMESIRSYNICPAIAEIEGKKVGFNFWIKMPAFDTKHEIAHALGTFVKKEYRGLGICRKLCEFSFVYLKASGIDKIYGKVFKERESSSKFISDLGFDKFEMLCKTL